MMPPHTKPSGQVPSVGPKVAGSDRPSIRVAFETPDAQSVEFRFSESFRIGRDESCQIQLESDAVSREHASIVPREGHWWVKDLDSTNGIYLDGHRVQHAALFDGAKLTVGSGGPNLRIALEHTSAEKPRTRNSLSLTIARYFSGSSDQPAGRRTQAIRQAYAVVKKKHRKRYLWIVLILAVIASITGSFGVSQRIENQRLEVAAADMFFDMKALDVQTFELRRVLAREQDAGVNALLAGIEEQRTALRSRYDGYIRELDVYRKIKTEEERLIHETARIFNESEFAMTAEFVLAVRAKIQYWQTTGRETFVEAIRRADQNGYTPFIVRTFLEHGLPPEFYYLGLQESAFEPERVGPPTRWGRAKGMWQFIPTTASEYGLDPGARARTAARDPTDERQDFTLSTIAAAQYLRDIHGTLTQASGLLVMAAYNWGEHRITGRLDSLATPREAFVAIFEDVPSNPRTRNYWHFLDAYGDRMPYETRDYVLKIFAAATIGQNPRLFGFDFDNPIERYLQ